jgi:hypothetical protein
MLEVHCSKEKKKKEKLVVAFKATSDDGRRIMS